MNKFKRVLSIATIGIFTMSFTGCIIKTQEGKDNTVVAKVGKETIKVLDVKKVMQPKEDELKTEYGNNYRTKSDIVDQLKSSYQTNLETLAEQKLLYIKAQELNLLPDTKNIDAEVQKEIDAIKASNFDNDQAKFDAALKSQSMTLDSLKSSIKEEIETNPESIATSRVARYMTKDVTVKDSEIEDYYNKNISQFTTKPGANFSHILVADEQTAKDIKAQIDKGAKFEDMAKKYGTDSTKDNGGSLGYIEYDTTSYDADFMAAAKLLKENEVSNPVKTQFGYHIIKATGIVTQAKVKPLADVKDQIKSQLLSTNEQTAYNNKLAEWKKEIGFTTYPDKLISNTF